ncbi:MAG: YbbN family protein [Candidatus Aminicenantales bacterium]
MRSNPFPSFRRKNGARRTACAVFFAALVFAAATPFPGQEGVLTGALDLNRILAAVPGWARAAKAYEPDYQAVEAIHRLGKSVRIRAFVGTWDAKETGSVAAFIKTIEMADNPTVAVDWIGVSRDLKEPAEPLRAYGVEKIPTFIIWADGEEKGRITGTPRETIESDLAAFLVGLPVSGADLNYFRHTPHSQLPIDCTPCHAPARPGGVRRPAAT